MMSSANIGWMFYKESFFHLKKRNEIDEKKLQTVNNTILKSKFYQADYSKSSHQNIKLTTTYPGLLIGTGYTHSLKNSAENFDFGFYFDHTTGLPVIPGSSVKGVLRSIFKLLKNSEKEKSVLAFFQECFKEIGIEEITKEQLQELENEIFEGVNQNKESISTYSRDKFFDAFISKGDSDSLLFADDSITPHDESGLTEPVPNRMLKIRSGVRFTFSFELYDGELLTASQKELFFLQLLQFNGIGAKTNVGYGQLVDTNNDVKKKLMTQIQQQLKEQEEQAKQEALAKMSPVDRIFTENEHNVVKIILKMQNSEIEDYGTIKVQLAQRVKEELQKNPKNWDKAKQKALKRREFIESILNI